MANQYLYILELANQRYYVGITADIVKRLRNHSGKWVNDNYPYKLIFSKILQTNDLKESRIIESDVTLLLMTKYGYDKVRGGGHAYRDSKLLQMNLLKNGLKCIHSTTIREVPSFEIIQKKIITKLKKYNKKI